MSLQPIQPLVYAGTVPTFNAATTSDQLPYGNGSNMFAVYKNANSSSTTLTVSIPGTTPYGVANPQPTFTVAATTGQVWIPLIKQYDDGTGEATVTITASSATSLTVAVVEVGAP